MRGAFDGMKAIMRKTFVLLSLLAGSLLSCSAKDLPGTGPMVVSENGMLEKDHQALRMRWAEKHLLADAEKRWAGKPWAEQARAVTMKGLKLWIHGPWEVGDAANKTANEAKALIATDCDEPLACLMAHKIYWQLKQSWWGGYAGLSKCFKMANDPAFSGALRVWIIDEQIDHFTSLNWSIDKLHTGQVERIIEALADGSYSAEFGAVLVRDFIDWMWNTKELTPESFDKLEKAIQDSSHSEWVKECLLGDVNVHRAWSIRGTAWAADVEKEAWEGFAKYLEIAGKHLKKAHDLQPDRPEAAARMLSVVLGAGGGAEKLRVWFDRAITAQLDYRWAYQVLIEASLKRWGGSDELVLTLARRFAETKRYDTTVPEQFFLACKQIAMERGDARQVFSSAEVKETAVSFARGLLEHQESNPAKAARNSSLAAITAWLAGDDELAGRGLKANNNIIEMTASKDLNQMLHHPSALRSSTFAGKGGWGEELRRLELLYRGGDRAATLDFLKSIQPEKLPTDNARNYLEELRTVAELPDKLKDGRWHSLPVFPGLTTCLCSGGSWRVTGPGELTFTGSDIGFADLAFPLQVKEALEVRGVVSYELIPIKTWQRDWSFGPSLRWLPARHGPLQAPHAVRGQIYHSRQGPVDARVTGTWNYQKAETQEFELKAQNIFNASLRGEMTSFMVNDCSIPPQDIAPFKLRHDSGLVALTAFYVPTGVKIKISKLEVRLAD